MLNCYLYFMLLLDVRTYERGKQIFASCDLHRMNNGFVTAWVSKPYVL